MSDVADETDTRAQTHREQAIFLAETDSDATSALVHALLAIEARLEELTCYVAKLS